jgi:vitamin B12 transporter
MLRRILPLPAAVVFLSLLNFVPAARGDEDLGTVVVSAAKHETPLTSVSTGATVITGEELRLRGREDLAEALRDIVSFDLGQAGGPGGLSAPQLRGLPGKFMVVMIDGVRVNDPTDANGGVGTLLSHLTTGDIARIEVIRGPQSPLYGSNAAAGVINIITRAAEGEKRFRSFYEGGSLSSQRANIGTSLGGRGFHLRADQEVTATGGLIELEKYRNYTTSLKLGYADAGPVEWETLVRYTRMRLDFSEFNENFDGGYGGAFWSSQVPDPRQSNRFGYTVIGNRLKHRINGNWQHELNLGISSRDRRTVDPDDGLLGWMTAPYDNFSLDWTNFYTKGQQVPVYDTPWGAQDYRYRGTNYDLDYRHTLLLSGARVSDILTGGFEYLYQDYAQFGTYGALDGHLYTASLYLHNQTLLAGDALSVNSGLRYDHNRETDPSFTGMLGLAYDIRPAGLILRANVGSAFRAPSVYELFNPSNGNLGLKPEESVTWETGIEKYALDKKLRLSLGYWSSSVDQVIIWVMTDPANYTGRYLNFDKAESRGLEAVIEMRPLTEWKVGFNYTYTDSRKYDRASGRWSRIVQVPYNKFNLGLSWQRGGNSVSLDSYWVDGSRLRWNGIDKMAGYFKLDLTARKPLTSQFTATLRVRNLLDRDYFENMGYREAGITAYGGVEFRY